ncbi:HAMP domain-containing histidine kinase [Pseudoclavibacter chungangensis]|uniref:histidine kinase n=1 Tax=Pseudoclavibacter chungangensis TaxID=587635 RepID=A0A7J5BTC5_9MICO|nr:HAMP domain-containing sensor histidine kinase [Pseudoclavibacter chungangensis]KAB1656797.1 HAMP domain-containing histidine kinase [Pseudoclavibacter chungangensis]NYJ67246.1 two-component system OmpR family sensor kinase [Pseudoclavibacter chungangensis]
MTRHPWTLRRRLVVGLVLLLAILSGVVGTTSIAILHQDLMSRLDETLEQNSMKRMSKFDDGVDQGRPPSGQQVPDNLGPGQKAGNLIVVTDGETVEMAVFVDESGTETQLPDAVVDTIRAGIDDSAPPRTLDLGDELGSYRLIERTDPRTGLNVYSGISTSEVETTIRNLVLIFVVVGLVALAIAAVAGVALVRRSLRPLENVAATAKRVSERDLVDGEVELPERVPEEQADPRTEVGQVGAALNRLLGHVEQSLVARYRSEQHLRQFVADASHELRTPLASVRGYTELARREPERLSETQTHSLARIDAESARMTALVEDLLLLARLDAGQRLRHEEVDVVRLVVEALSDAQAADRGHVWELEAPDEELVVTGDGDRLRQVLANLLANARHHTPDGTRVTASVAARDGIVEVRVSDAGPGIPPELLPEIFGRFVRGDASRTRRGASAGLGLSISQAIVESHGGTIDVDSEPGRTTFTVRLPEDAGAATAVAEPSNGGDPVRRAAADAQDPNEALQDGAGRDRTSADHGGVGAR